MTAVDIINKPPTRAATGRETSMPANSLKINCPLTAKNPVCTPNQPIPVIPMIREAMRAPYSPKTNRVSIAVDIPVSLPT